MQTPALSHRATESLHDGAASRTSWPPIVLVSNRGPVEYQLDGDAVVVRRGSGGLITALDSLLRSAQGTWVAAALTDGDRVVAGGGRLAPTAGWTMGVRLVALDPEVARRHYSRFSNPLLWFLQHGLTDLLRGSPTVATADEDWQRGYVPANRALAAAAVEEACAFLRSGVRPIVSVHDYQLYLLPQLVRSALPQVPLQFFLHIPWPEPAAWHALPWTLVRAICESLLNANLIGFQTVASAERFIATCRRFVPGVARLGADLLGWRGRPVFVRSYPISVDVERLREQTRDPQFQRHRARLSAGWTGQTIVRVDRLDPSKNLLVGFAAYERLLERRPDLHGRVRLLAFLVPSRSTIPEYRAYAEAVLGKIEAINVAYGTAAWRPIQLFYEHNYLQALAGMALADVLFVNPVADGMNLVAKEGVVVSERDAVLVLSTAAGAYAELGPAALGVRPNDLDGTTAALERALALPAAERRARLRWLRTQVEQHDVRRWIQRRYGDLVQIARFARDPLWSGLVPVVTAPASAGQDGLMRPSAGER